jgi:5'-3' exonuclease
MQIVDGGMFAFSAWHALKGKVSWPLTFQVPRMLRRIISESSDTWVVCWNGDHQWKRAFWPAYRNRPEIWDEAGREDYAAMLDVLAAVGVVQYRTDHLEADEAIAALVHRLEGSEQLVIRSDDKDFMQLLSGSTRMEGRVRGTVRFSRVREILGVSPAYVADFLALSGDTADGIPRIVSPATAIKLLASRGHVRDWIDRDLRVADGVRSRLVEGREQLRINLALVDLSAPAVEAHGAPGTALLDRWGDWAAAREIGARSQIAWLAAPEAPADFAVVRQAGERTRRRLGC